jgi:hypothetical protein
MIVFETPLELSEGASKDAEKTALLTLRGSLEGSFSARVKFIVLGRMEISTFEEREQEAKPLPLCIIKVTFPS